MLRKFLLSATLVAASSAAFASPVYIYADRIIAIPGKPPLGPSTIIVENGRIRDVRAGHVPAVAGAAAIDLGTKTVLPGLIDSHVHLDSDAGGNNALIEYVTMNAPQVTMHALANAKKTLLAGFTTVRNLGDLTGATMAIRDAAKSGEIDAPRIVDAGHAISTTAGHMDFSNGFAEYLHPSLLKENVCDGADSCRKAVRVQVQRGADVIKIATTGGVNSRIGAGVGAQMFDDEARAIVQTANLYGKKVAVHAHGADGINMALRAGASSIEHGTLLDDESIRLFKQTGAYLVPTLSTVNGYIERLAADPNAYSADVLPKVRWRISVTGKNVQRAYPAGVKIAFGTDAGVSKHGRNADEFELLVKYGMPPVEALKAATVNAAELLGLEKEIGTIEVGKSADIIAVEGDPLADVTVLKAVKFVMARGKVVKGEEWQRSTATASE